MRRFLFAAVAAATAAGLTACSTTSRQASRFGAQPPAGTVVQTGQLSANPTPEVVPAVAAASPPPAAQSRLSFFDLKKDCKL